MKVSYDVFKQAFPGEVEKMEKIYGPLPDAQSYNEALAIENLKLSLELFKIMEKLNDQ